MEIVRESARLAGVDGEARGWWTQSELKAFGATANNPRLVGHKARHGKTFTADGQLISLPRRSMDEMQAGWFVRGVYARWIRDLDPPPSEGKESEESSHG